MIHEKSKDLKADLFDSSGNTVVNLIVLRQ